jgi:hypothetical protein
MGGVCQVLAAFTYVFRGDVQDSNGSTSRSRATRPSLSDN